MYTSAVIPRIYNFLKRALGHDMSDEARREVEIAAGLLSPIVPQMTQSFSDFRGREAVKALREVEKEREAGDIESLLVALAAARVEIERLETEVTCLKLDKDENLPAAAIAAVRDMLIEQNVPGAAFIDDHVANVIVQRNHAHKAFEEARTMLRDKWVTHSAAEDLEKEAAISRLEHRLLEVGFGKPT